jgi:hypothetical protein
MQLLSGRKYLWRIKSVKLVRDMMFQLQCTNLIRDVIRTKYEEFTFVLKSVVDNLHQVAIIFFLGIQLGHEQGL